MNLKSQIDFNELKSARLLIVLFSGFLVFLFLWFFQPFELKNFEIENKILFLAGYGGIVSFIMFCSYYLIPFFWKRFFTYKFWNAGFHLAFLAFNLILIAFLNRIYCGLTGFYDFNPFSLVHYIFYTMSVGLLPIALTIFFVDRILLKNKFEQIAKKTEQNKIKPDNQDATITIKSDKIKDQLTLALSNIMYFQADDNYVNIYFLQDGTVTKQLMRITLSQIEKQLFSYYQIVRCHRSYIVNLDKVKSVEGKSQHYSFVIPQLPNSIPVSKTFPKSIIDTLSSN